MTASDSTPSEGKDPAESIEIEESVRREVAQGQLDMTADMVHRLGQQVRHGDKSIEEIVDEIEDARAMLKIIEDVVTGGAPVSEE